MFYIIGLGNPGEKYQYTRHNISWLIFDNVHSGGWSLNKYMNPQTSENECGLFIKPQTFMNNSGEVISFLKKNDTKINPEKIIIVYDDIDLPFGSIKISFDRGDGGHNGVKSVSNHLGTKGFIRVRIGISRLLEDGRLVKPNVLGPFSEDERLIIKGDLSQKFNKIINSFHVYGLGKTMNLFNTK